MKYGLSMKKIKEMIESNMTEINTSINTKVNAKASNWSLHKSATKNTAITFPTTWKELLVVSCGGSAQFSALIEKTAHNKSIALISSTAYEGYEIFNDGTDYSSSSSSKSRCKWLVKTNSINLSSFYPNKGSDQINSTESTTYLFYR